VDRIDRCREEVAEAAKHIAADPAAWARAR